MTFLVDSHCHLASLRYEGKGAKNLQEAIKRANEVKVSHFLAVSCTTLDFKKTQELTRDFDNIYLALGIHPLNLEEEPNWSDDEVKKLLLSDDRVIAVGETGLDYFYASETKELQKPSFVRHIEIAHEVKKPLIIHAREAHKDTLDILRALNARDIGGVIHCFTDSVDMARECLDLGFYISFTGITTFKNSENVREVARFVPTDRMMVETDCPYLAPIPVRGIENEPAYVRYTLQYLAELKGTSEKKLAEITSKNFEDLFKLKLQEPKFLDIEANSYKLEKIWRKEFKD